jgi:polysaccharide export outer membrane protein
MLRNRLVSCLLLSLAATAAFCQQAGTAPASSKGGASPVAAPAAAPDATTSERTTLASATLDYPVTPGDIYRLTYVYASAVVTLSIPVSSDFTVNLSIFGQMDASQLSFSALRDRVEEKVLKVYPGTGPQLTIQSVGVFKVYLTGEVGSSGWAPAWGLSRLSDIVTERLTPYSSLRAIDVVSSSGSQKEYDLFLASRAGRRDMDPYVRPGDTITVRPRGREVTIVGEVERPGTYQLLDGEQLREALTAYAGGWTVFADTSRVEVTRWDAGVAPPGQMFSVDGSSLDTPVALRDMDVVRVPSKKERLPVVYFEGAIAPASGSADQDPQAFARVAYAFVDGESLRSAATALYERFGSGSDLEHAFVVRSGMTIPVNLRELVLGSGLAQDLLLQPFDRIVIPFHRYIVTVSGAVARPGQYPYVAGRSWRYYVELAGGFDPDRHAGEAIEITNVDNQARLPGQPIEAEDRVLAPTNNPLRVVVPLLQITGALASVATALLALAQFLHL